MGRLLSTWRLLRVEMYFMEQAAEEHPPEYDPQANGAIESTVGAFKGQIRTYVLSLESRLGFRIPPEHPILAWLVPHTAFMMTARIKAEDGKTAYERVRLRPFGTRMLEFGEFCRHKLRLHDVQKEGTLAARWGRGIFLGICRMT